MKDQEYCHSNINGVLIPHFEYKETPLMGIGKNRQLFVNMDQYINHELDEELHIECCKGLALANDYKPGTIGGVTPPEEQARIHDRHTWTELLYEIEKHDPTGIHRKTIKEIVDVLGNTNAVTAIYKYVYYAMGAAIPWYFACYLKEAGFKSKGEEGVWTNNAKYFPKLIKYLETLPFKTIGRVLFFTSYPNAGVLCHRDSVVAEHKDHNINLFFSPGRPSYLWDPVKKEKSYLDPTAKSYFFNNRDFHGVDPEPVFRYTLRIDGTFTDELCEQLGLEDGYTWKWDYLKEQNEN